MRIHDKAQSDDIYKALASLSDAEEVKALLTDLCTPQELMAIRQRFTVAEMLWEGKYYNEIIEATGASSATISRVKRSLYDAKGYGLIFKEQKV